jgi:hypothetical protein
MCFGALLRLFVQENKMLFWEKIHAIVNSRSLKLLPPIVWSIAFSEAPEIFSLPVWFPWNGGLEGFLAG